jgi:hypothetical protein
MSVFVVIRHKQLQLMGRDRSSVTWFYSSDPKTLHTRSHDGSAIDVYIRAMFTIIYG